jgi:hypothetical protein
MSTQNGFVKNPDITFMSGVNFHISLNPESAGGVKNFRVRLLKKALTAEKKEPLLLFT